MKCVSHPSLPTVSPSPLLWWSYDLSVYEMEDGLRKCLKHDSEKRICHAVFSVFKLQHWWRNNWKEYLSDERIINFTSNYVQFCWSSKSAPVFGFIYIFPHQSILVVFLYFFTSLIENSHNKNVQIFTY